MFGPFLLPLVQAVLVVTAGVAFWRLGLGAEGLGKTILAGLAPGLLVLLAFIYVESMDGPEIRRRKYGCCPESSAVANLRTINTAEGVYLSNAGKYGTIPEMLSLGLFDGRWRFERPVLFGYEFSIKVSDSGYTATAMPISTNAGRCGFYTTQDGVVRYQTAVIPGESDRCPGTPDQPVQ